MSRQARQLSQSGLYHIVFRGINRQHIFEDDNDYLRMIEIIKTLKTEIDFEIYAYCFMTNHAHILLKEGHTGDIITIMKRLLTKYARLYNIKYDRNGSLIANRYKSQPIEVDEYFLSVVRYIHQNPLKAQMVNDLRDYRWSSYLDYVSKREGLTNTDFVLNMISKSAFIQFHKIDEIELFAVSDKIKKTDEAIRREIIKKLEMEPKQIGSLLREQRNEILKELKERYSIRQIERVTGVSRGVIYKAGK